MHSREIEQYKTKLKLTDEQREILIGMLLGDATLETCNNGRTYKVRIEHSTKQQAYVAHLYDAFKEWVLTKPQTRKITLSNGKTYESIRFTTLSHGSFRFYAHQFYKGNSKIVPKFIKRWLTPRVLAYWYMDDGSIKSKQSKGVIFNTQGYSKQEVIRLVAVLKTVFHLESVPRRQKEGYQIYISGFSYEKFRNLVEQYMLPEMMYKIPKARRTQFAQTVTEESKGSLNSVGNGVVSVKV